MARSHLTRHELVKRDEFVETIDRIWFYLEDHWKQILTVAGVAVVAVALFFGVRWYLRSSQARASADFEKAMLIFHAPLVGEQDVVRLPNQPIYATADERAKKALGEFERLSKDYRGKLIGDRAEYYVALCQLQLNRTAEAQTKLEALSARASNEISGLVALTLADLYAQQENSAKAIELYKKLIDHPPVLVPRLTAMRKLAEYYKRLNRYNEAASLYEQIKKEFPSQATTPAINSALEEINALRAGVKASVH